MKIFRVYFKDGNQKLFEAEALVDLFDYLIRHEEANNIYKIEEVE